jgi:hypothetical protein
MLHTLFTYGVTVVTIAYVWFLFLKIRSFERLLFGKEVSFVATSCVLPNFVTLALPSCVFYGGTLTFKDITTVYWFVFFVATYMSVMFLMREYSKLRYMARGVFVPK